MHRDAEASVVVLEYTVHGRSVRTGRAYDNHFISVVTVKDREAVRWRDCPDPVAVFRALGWATMTASAFVEEVDRPGGTANVLEKALVAGRLRIAVCGR